ncbi:MAG: amino acid ABC transporter permease [Candidatus Adiutrix sp.]|jgi:polar amino acid transport system permease protein|nr:amino acid ABC transporter permease [Candidatus Adiutrix sp.]
MTLPYKKRRLDKALSQSAVHPEPAIQIEMNDGPAIPRKTDPGLYSAWKFVVIAAPCLYIYLATYDQIAALLVSAMPGLGESWGWLKKIAGPEYVNSYRDAFLFIMPDGFYVTLQVTCLGIGVSIPVGIMTGLCRVSRIRIINLIASVYVEVVRGIPLLVQLFYIYYGVASIIRINPFMAAIISIGFCYGAYIGEVVRSGIEAVDRGQREAAMSLGFTPFQAMRHVILPQAIRTILPPLGNECISMLKDSSLVSMVAIIDILRRGREYASTTFNYFESYTMVALSYLFITLILSKGVSLLETRMGRYERR